MNRRPLALIDIDGVIANDTHRVQFALEKNWAEYFDPQRMSDDAVWPQGRAMIQDLIEEGKQIGYLTGRREDRRTVTRKWLKHQGFPRGPLLMRPMGMKLRLADLKVETMRPLLERYPKVALFDDDPEVVAAVNEAFGWGHAFHCTWYKKPAEMVRKAVA